MSPGRKPRLSPASTAGRASTMRRTRLRASASTAAATARYVFPVPAGPMPTTMSFSGHQLHVLGLPGGLGLDDLANAGQHDARLAVDAVAVPVARPFDAHAEHVVRRERHLLLGRVDHPLRDRYCPRYRLRVPADRQRLAAEGDLCSCLLRQLDEILVVHSGQRQHVRAFCREALNRCLFAHVRLVMV